jgi:hypothetical protein
LPFKLNPITGQFDLVNPAPDLSGYFQLDQTTPQTVINGTPIFNVGIQTNAFKMPTAPTAGFVLTTDNAGIASWQAIPVQGQGLKYLTNVNSAAPVGDFKQTVNQQVSKVQLDYSGITSTPSIMKTWITDAGFPGVSFIPAGEFELHVHLSNAGGGSMTAYGEFWETDSAGTDIALIGTTVTTYVRTGAYIDSTETEYRLFFSRANVYTMASTSSRIALKLYGKGQSGTHQIEVYVGGTSDSHIGFPTPTVSTVNFVPYTGATTDVDLGAHYLNASAIKSPKFYPASDSTTAIQFLKADGTSPILTLDTTNNRLGIMDTAPTQRFAIGGHLRFTTVAKPTTAVTATLAGVAGNVDNGDHYYYVKYVSADGQTGYATTPEATITVTDKTTNGKVQLTNIPISPDPRVTGRKIYRTKQPGTQRYIGYLLTTINDNTTTSYLDNTADASLTTTDPYYNTPNTTAGKIFIDSSLSLFSSAYNLFLGTTAGGIISTGVDNTFIGASAGAFATTAQQNVYIGSGAGRTKTSGVNVAIGYDAFEAGAATGAYNTIVGAYAGRYATGDYNAFFGRYAGYQETGSNKIIIDTLDRTDEATSRTAALIYGVTNATVANQILCLGGGGKVGIGTLTPTATLEVSASKGDTFLFRTINTYASGSAGGSGMIGYQDDGAAMGTDERLGYLLFGGATDGAHTLVQSAGMNGYASEAWSSTAQGSHLTFVTTPKTFTTASRAERMRITDAGKVGIGATAPSAFLHILGTTEQLRLGYDTSNYLSTTIDATGNATLALAGTTPIFTFSQAIHVDGGIQSSDGSAGITTTIVTAQLTALGAQGSMTFKNGILTASTPAT